MPYYTRRQVLSAAALAPLMTKLCPASFEVEVDSGALEFRAFERWYYPPLPLDPALEVIRAYEHQDFAFAKWAGGLGLNDVQAIWPPLSARATKILLAAFVCGGPELDHNDHVGQVYLQHLLNFP